VPLFWGAVGGVVGTVRPQRRNFQRGWKNSGDRGQKTRYKFIVRKGL
jgi:hypothetical protein